MEPLEANEIVADKPVLSRLRLTALATLVVAVVTLVAGLALMFIQHRVLTNELDDQLESYSANIERDLEAGTTPRLLEQQGSEAMVAQVVFEDNLTVLASTGNMAGQRPLESPNGDVQHRTTTLAISDDTYRVLSRRVGTVVIHTGIPSEDTERADDALRVGLAFTIPAMTLLFGFLAWWLIGRRADIT